MTFEVFASLFFDIVENLCELVILVLESDEAVLKGSWSATRRPSGCSDELVKCQNSIRPMQELTVHQWRTSFDINLLFVCLLNSILSGSVCTYVRGRDNAAFSFMFECRVFPLRDSRIGIFPFNLSVVSTWSLRIRYCLWLVCAHCLFARSQSVSFMCLYDLKLVTLYFLRILETFVIYLHVENENFRRQFQK